MRYGWLFALVAVVGCGEANSPVAPTPFVPPVAAMPTNPTPPPSAPPTTPPAAAPLPLSDPRFNLALFRQLAHNALDGPLQPLRRYSQAPRIYLRTIDEDGRAIDPRTLDDTARVLEHSAGEMTGVFGLAGLERGTAHRMGQTGWLTIRWLPQASNPNRMCGQAHVGQEGGTLDLFPYQGNCGCLRYQVAPRVIRHELGHALGFWHTDGPGDLMRGGQWDFAQCEQSMNPREIFHAAVAYQRPIGSPAP